MSAASCGLRRSRRRAPSAKRVPSRRPSSRRLRIARSRTSSKLLLLLDDVLDLAILNRLELGRRDGTLFALGARLLERRRPQEAADMIGTKWRFGPLH